MSIINKKRNRNKNNERAKKIDEVLNELTSQVPEIEEINTDKVNDLSESTIEGSQILENEFGGGDVNPPPEPPEEDKVEVEKEEVEEQLEYKQPHELNGVEYRYYLNTGKLPLKK